MKLTQLLTRATARRLAWLKQQLCLAIGGQAFAQESLKRSFIRSFAVCLVGLLSLGMGGCNSDFSKRVRVVALPDPPDLLRGAEVRRLSGAVSEVASPAIFLDLNQLMAQAQPQVAIASPKADQVVDTNQIEVQLKLSGLSIYKDETLGLGPHIQVFLDNQPAQSVYGLDEALTFTDLAPGSHTLRAIAVRPWGESFKNDGAYAQLTFHVLAETGENTPVDGRPLLTYLEPQGTYGAEPVLLDFYLHNVPLHSIAQDLAAQDVTGQDLSVQNSPQPDNVESERITDWRIRASINGQSFVLDQWQALYLKGLTPGQNWVQLTLIDTAGHPIKDTFNSTVRTFTYEPEQQDTLAKIVRGELSLEQVGQIAVPDYVPSLEPEELEPEELEPEELEPEELEPEELESENLDPENLELKEPLNLTDQLPPAQEESEVEMPEIDPSKPETSERVEESGLAEDVVEFEKNRQKDIDLDGERSQLESTTPDESGDLEAEPLEIELPDVEASDVTIPNTEVPDTEVPDAEVLEVKTSEVEMLDVNLSDAESPEAEASELKPKPPALR